MHLVIGHSILLIFACGLITVTILTARVTGLRRLSQKDMGVERNVIVAGTGARPQHGQTVTVQCTGFLTDGRRRFWSTRDAGQAPYQFIVGLGHAIRGLDEGVAAMQVGERAELVVSHEHGYGPRGFEAWGIGPNAGLTFEVELLSIGST